MFENLSERLASVFKQLKSRGKLTAKDVEGGLKEVRLALLEADVHYRVVKRFVADVATRALGEEVLASLTPGQQVVKIVNERLTELMGTVNAELDLAGPRPVPLMLAGLQGAGKTTTAGKLAVYLRQQGRRPYLIPADVYRPAAIDQLRTLGRRIDVPVYPSADETDPVRICLQGRAAAHRDGCDTVIIDTAGRLHIDRPLMEELQRIRDAVHPADILLVADAMTGQDAVNSAKAFDEALDIGGVVLTKMDGDARGGAALSIRAITGKPIKFVGTGEKPGALEVFHPDRMAGKILGMGDVLSLIEKARAVVHDEEAARLERKLRKNEFTLEDFRDQLLQISKMGSLGDLLSMIPGLGRDKQLKNLQVEEKELDRVVAIIGSMTPDERSRHAIINGSRRKRIAAGSGTSVQAVNRLLKNYGQMLKMMKKINKGGMRGAVRGSLPF